MGINADFARRVAIDTRAMPWSPSPMPGVDRRMLDRIGEEKARATSIVRYAPNSSFPSHRHPGGEELFILEGVFEDEHGSYPAGTYVRNPPGTAHAPASTDGCVIFVKLWQFDPQDDVPVRIDTPEAPFTSAGAPHGSTQLLLHVGPQETVRLLRLPAETKITLSARDGLEILVLDGAVRIDGDGLTQQGWWRGREEKDVSVTSGDDDALIYAKSGHLAHVRFPDDVAV